LTDSLPLFFKFLCGQILGVDAYEMGIVQINVLRLGADLSFHCLYNPTKENRPFIIVLSDCSKLIWDVYIDDFEPYLSVPVISLYTGEAEYKVPLNLTTRLFDLTAHYKALRVEKVW
jgi:hypothetical protein